MASMCCKQILWRLLPKTVSVVRLQTGILAWKLRARAVSAVQIIDRMQYTRLSCRVVAARQRNVPSANQHRGSAGFRRGPRTNSATGTRRAVWYSTDRVIKSRVDCLLARINQQCDPTSRVTRSVRLSATFSLYRLDYLLNSAPTILRTPSPDPC